MRLIGHRHRPAAGAADRSTAAGVQVASFFLSRFFLRLLHSMWVRFGSDSMTERAFRAG